MAHILLKYSFHIFCYRSLFLYVASILYDLSIKLLLFRVRPANLTALIMTKHPGLQGSYVRNGTSKTIKKKNAHSFAIRGEGENGLRKYVMSAYPRKKYRQGHAISVVIIKQLHVNANTRPIRKPTPLLQYATREKFRVQKIITTSLHLITNS